MNDISSTSFYNEPSSATTAVRHLARVGGFLALLLLCAFWASAQNVNIPDANFKSRLVADLTINTNEDTEIQVSEAEAFTDPLNVTSANIADLTGIEAFVNITKLFCYNNSLTSLDVSSNLALTDLKCNSNQIISLDVSKNINLETLECHFNQLTSLITNGATALTSLVCYNNQLESLDLGESTNLNNVSCQRNQLATLNIGSNTTLDRLSCDKNKLTALDVSGATGLSSLTVYDNELTSLNLPNNKVLTHLICSQNQLSTLDLSGCLALTRLHCDENKLTQLDLSANADLEVLNVNDNELTAIDLSSNTLLDQLFIENNLLSALDMSANTLLDELSVSNNLLTSLDVSANSVLTVLKCTFNQLTELDLSNNLLLEKLNCSNDDGSTKGRIRSFGRLSTAKTAGTGNRLTSLDLRVNDALTFLDCSFNELTHLDLRNGNNSALRTVYAEENSLTCILVDDTQEISRHWSKDAETSYCSDLPTSVNLSCDWSATNQSPLPVSVTFDAAVTGFELSDLDVSNGTAANLHTTDQMNYTVDITPVEEGIVTINLAANQVENSVGDPNAPALALSVDYDVTPPTALIFTSSTTQNPILVTVKFSEVVSDFDLADLSIVNCTIDKLETTDMKTYSLEVSPLKSGLLTIDLAINQVQDLAGNGNLEATQFAVKYGVVAGWLEEEQFKVSLYPNPTVDLVHIQMSNGGSHLGDVQMVLTDLQGKKILHEAAQFDQAGLMAIDLASYPAGLYLLQLTLDHTQVIKKVRKQ